MLQTPFAVVTSYSGQRSQLAIRSDERLMTLSLQNL